MTDRKIIPIQERSFDFSLRIIELCRYLDSVPGISWSLSKQLFKSGTSVGANIEEAQAAQSKADFINKMNISLKEARETLYWIRLAIAGQFITEAQGISLRDEATEIANILGAIIANTKKNLSSM